MISLTYMHNYIQVFFFDMLVLDLRFCAALYDHTLNDVKDVVLYWLQNVSKILKKL